MGVGKLYMSSSEDSALKVSYRLHDENPTHWWGELILLECKHINDGTEYIIELEDKRKGECHLKNKINQVLNKVASCYIYDFTGTSSLN